MKQWYEIDPELLEMERKMMLHSFPTFKLEKLEDGRLCWIGELTPCFYETKFNEHLTYLVMAVYNNNYTITSYQERMDGKVRVYPIRPDADELINRMGFKHQLFKIDSANNYYINPGLGTASMALSRTISWLALYELFLMGEIEIDLFKGLSSIG